MSNLELMAYLAGHWRVERVVTQRVAGSVVGANSWAGCGQSRFSGNALFAPAESEITKTELTESEITKTEPTNTKPTEREFENTRSGLPEYRSVVAGLRYEEMGRHDFGGVVLEAGRRYFYRSDDPTRMSVLFEDGRYFHTLDLSAGVWDDVHVCGQDVYSGRFEAISTSVWMSRWHVLGPQKNFLIETAYRR